MSCARLSAAIAEHLYLPAYTLGKSIYDWYTRKPPGSRYVPGRAYKAGRIYTARRRRYYRRKARRATGVKARRITQRRPYSLRSGGYLGLEHKFIDSGHANQAISVASDATGGELQPNVGCVGCISAPAQGDGESARDGRKYTITDIEIRGLAFTQASGPTQTAAAPPVMRFYMVLDKQANGATINSEDVFENHIATSGMNAAGLARNLENIERFDILDEVVVTPPPPLPFTYQINTGTTNVTSTAVTAGVPFRLAWSGRMTVNMAGTTADVANVRDNAVHFIGFASNSIYVASVSWEARCRFLG